MAGLRIFGCWVAVLLGAALSQTALAGIDDLSKDERNRLRDVLIEGDLKEVRKIFAKHGLKPSDKIQGTDLYWYGVTGVGRTGEQRLQLIEYLLEQGGPAGDGTLNERSYLLSFVPEATPQFVEMLDSRCDATPPTISGTDSALARAAATQNPELVKMMIQRGEEPPAARPRISTRTYRDDEERLVFSIGGPPPEVAAVSGGNYNFYVGMDGKFSIDRKGKESRSGKLLKLWRSKVRPGGTQRRPVDQKAVIEVLKLLDDAGFVAWNKSDAFRMTPLHYAAILNLPQVTEFLASKDATVDKTDYFGRTPLLATAEGKGKVDGRLLDVLAGEDNEGLSATDSKGNTVISLALKAGNSEFVSQLIRRGVDPFIVNDELRSAAGSAKPGSNEEKAIAEGLVGMSKLLNFQYRAQPQKRIVSMPTLLVAETAQAAVGSSSKTILTLNERRPAYAGGPMNVRFNRPVGSSMQKSLPKVAAHIISRVGGWPDGLEAEIRFENRYGGKDGDSASVVCGLLLYSALTSYEIDPGFCCTGAMEPDGKVKPIGGLAQKLAAVNRAGLPIMGIPPENADDLRDHVLLNGIADLAHAQVFTMQTFDDALALAATDKPTKLAEAIENCAPVMRVLGEGKLEAIKHPSVQKKLREVLALEPQHITAQVLLEAGTGRLPKTLSLGGCFEALNNAYRPVGFALNNSEFDKLKGFDENLYATAVSMLTRLRPKLDPRARKLADYQSDYARALQKVRESPPISEKGINDVIANLDALRGKVDAETDSFRKLYAREVAGREGDTDGEESP